MASYAEIASHGPKQSDEENPVPSYAEQGKQAEEDAKKAEKEAQQAVNKASDSVKDTAKVAGTKIDEYEREGQKAFDETKKEGKKAYDDVKAEVKKDYKEVQKQAEAGKEKVKKSAKHAEKWAEENRNNPVVVGNAVVVTALAGLIGVGAYRKYIAGELDWKVAGTWAGVVGLFAVGDYYVSSWLFKNKYPPKN